MNKQTAFGRSTLAVIIAVLSLFTVFSTGCSRVASEAKEILELSGVQGGFVVHINCGDGALTEALKLNDGYIVHGLDPSEDNVMEARKYIMSKQEYGPISVDRLMGNRLPYTDNMVNLIIAGGVWMG